MYLRKTTSRGKEYYQLCETENGRVKVIRHLGNLEQINKKFQYVEELEATVSMLKDKLSQYVGSVNQVWDKIESELKKG